MLECQKQATTPRAQQDGSFVYMCDRLDGTRVMLHIDPEGNKPPFKSAEDTFLKHCEMECPILRKCSMNHTVCSTDK